MYVYVCVCMCVCVSVCMCVRERENEILERSVSKKKEKTMLNGIADSFYLNRFFSHIFLPFQFRVEKGKFS